MACHWQPNAFCGLTPTPTLDGPRAEGQREEKITPVWPCEPLCALFPERAVSTQAPPYLFGASLGLISGICGGRKKKQEFAEDERKSRRKNRRFCSAGSLTTARSAGSCGILKGRCSGPETETMALFSVEFGCLLRTAKNCWGAPGLWGRECPSQELRY